MSESLEGIGPNDDVFEEERGRRLAAGAVA
jgi:hypothetical protein